MCYQSLEAPLKCQKAAIKKLIRSKALQFPLVILFNTHWLLDGPWALRRPPVITLLTCLISQESYWMKAHIHSSSSSCKSFLRSPPLALPSASASSSLPPCLSSSSPPHLPNWSRCILSSAPQGADRRMADGWFEALLCISTALFLFVSLLDILCLSLFI